MVSEYFRKIDCPSCGAKIIIDQSKCPYCERELEFVWKLGNQEEIELKKHLDELNRNLGSVLYQRQRKPIEFFQKIFQKRMQTKYLDQEYMTVSIDYGRRLSYFLTYLTNLSYIIWIPILFHIVFHSITGLVFMLALIGGTSYLITHFQIEKDVYSRRKMVNVAREKFLPQTKDLLKKLNIGWTDFDQFVVTKYLTQEQDAHGLLAFMVYIDER